jgi:endo-alpha-1,4-polygalactosaminidase (GH114 family)
MFTEYHLEKIIQAINDAEERQTKAIVAAIKEATQPKPKPVFLTTPKGGLDMFEQAYAETEGNAKTELTEEERFGGKIEPIECPDVLGEEDAVKRMKESFNKARAQKKTSATKKPTPVRSRS